jgi:hypothetical protein
MLREKPGIASPIGSGALSRDLRELSSAEERQFLAGLSLLANFGVTLAVQQMVLAISETSKRLVPVRRKARATVLDFIP